MTKDVKDALERIRRVQSGENGYAVYFPDKFGKENEVWSVADEYAFVRMKSDDLRLLALAFLEANQ